MNAIIEKRHRAKLQFAEQMRPVLHKLMVQGSARPRALARSLNALNHPTRRSGNWHSSTVIRILNLLGPEFAASVRAEKAKVLAAVFEEMGCSEIMGK